MFLSSVIGEVYHVAFQYDWDNRDYYLWSLPAILVALGALIWS
jgi:hypothetical protein